MPAAGPVTPAPATAPALGITEANPALIWAPGARGREAEPFVSQRAALAALHPRYYRLQVDWSLVQPRSDVAPNWDRPDPGCARGAGPCAPYRGVREQLRAVRSRQRAQGGWEVVVNFLYTPRWAAREPGGCEPGFVDPSYRQIAPAALPAYRALIASLLALGRQEGVELRYWSAWNESNYRGFASPQRTACTPGSRLLAPGYYAGLVRALRAELAGAPGRHDVLLGELSDAQVSGPKATSTVEFIRGLAPDVICGSPLWSQHLYLGDVGGLSAIEGALDARGCGRRHRIWITETGAGGPSPGARRPTDPASLRAQCRGIDGLLRGWHADRRVDAVFQYSYREDPAFPVGLADASLSRRYPAYDAWLAWGRRGSTAGAPALPASCQG
ncbi:MAG: hypothetical protein M3Z33_09060 [Actinomycetota bacterium]|nr:hypothetical protein [Actinomycetota bacterium]